MPRAATSTNPFYSLLIVVGTVFAVTAIAYGIMALAVVRDAEAISVSATMHPLLAWLREHGDVTMLVELGILGALTFAAIGTDDFWDRRARMRAAAGQPAASTSKHEALNPEQIRNQIQNLCDQN